MKKTTTLPVSGETATAAESSTAKFRIKPGVEWVNGKRVPKGVDTVTLTSVEAAFDLGLDRISPADKPAPASWQKAESNGGD